MIVRIEKHYKLPQDIEWALEDDKFYVVQSRPITTLSKKGVDDEKDSSMVNIIKKTDWYADWSGYFPMLEVSTSQNTYIDGLKKTFSKCLSHYFVIYENGIAFAKLPYDEVNDIGIYLAKKLEDLEYAKEWAKNFKEAADEI